MDNNNHAEAVAISVLVPVYNVEKTLDRCVQSILNQTFQNFEIILVNDGSTDQSGIMCDRYAEKYDNIRVVHKKNEGLGPTRNVAIKEACGTYIYHCDSDDWLRENLLENAYKAIVSADAEVAIFGYDLFTERNGEVMPYGSVKCSNKTISGKENIRRFFVEQYFNSFVVMSACNRIYKRAFLLENELFFPELRRCQDMAYSLLLFEHLSKLVTIEDAYYCYIIEPGVYKGRSYAEMMDIYCYIFEATSRCFEKWGFYDSNTEQKLINNCCEQIANYSAYAFAVKYKDQWKENATLLLKDDRIKRLFAQYQNRKSRFMKLFALSYRIQSRVALLVTARLAEQVKKKR